MRFLTVVVGLLLLMRFGGLVPIGSTHPGGANLGTLTFATVMAIVPLAGIVSLFRMFARWHRVFHTQMKTDGIPYRRRDR
jgi:hypothetical protein